MYIVDFDKRIHPLVVALRYIISPQFCVYTCILCMYIDFIFVFLTSNVTASQDAHKRLVLQVYLGLNTFEFSAIRR